MDRVGQPKYLAYDEKHREQFLSQLGTFSPGERDVFHKLCQNWQPKIPYERFAAIISREDSSTAADVASIMDKLKQRRLGLLRSEYREGERRRSSIILTEQHDPVFYRELVEEYFVDMIESITNPFPFLSTLRSEFDGVPPGVFHVVTSNEIAQFFSGEKKSAKALAIPVLDDEQILVNSDKLRPFLNLAILKMRHHLSSTSLLGAIAKLLDSSLLNLKDKISGKEPSFWHQFASTVIEKRADLTHNRNVSVSPLFFHAAWIVRALVEAQLAEAEEKKRLAEEQNLDHEAIALAIKDAPEGIIDEQGLDNIFETQKEKYGDRIAAFKDRFFTIFVDARDRKSLPTIVRLDQRYIHRDNVFPMFIEHFHEIEVDLKAEFILRMERSLRGATRRTDNAFLSVENFEAAIASSVRSRSEYLAAMIKNPGILAEAMILHAKQNKLAGSVHELKDRLSLYFDPDTLKPLPLREWFSLRLTEIFEHAFEKLPIIRRIWIRLSGKYDSLRGKFIGTGITPSSSRTYDAPARVEPRRSKRQAGRRPSSSARPPRVERPRRRRSVPNTEVKKRPYSKKQIDSAWDSFGDAIRKDPK